MNIKQITYTSTGIVLAACVGFSLLFTLLPFLGWSHYALESNLGRLKSNDSNKRTLNKFINFIIDQVTCGVEWAERTWNVQSWR